MKGRYVFGPEFRNHLDSEPLVSGFAHIKQNTDLNAPRDRADFQALLKELEAKPPEKP